MFTANESVKSGENARGKLQDPAGRHSYLKGSSILISCAQFLSDVEVLSAGPRRLNRAAIRVQEASLERILTICGVIRFAWSACDPNDSGILDDLRRRT